jgi:hypothetical protein
LREGLRGRPSHLQSSLCAYYVPQFDRSLSSP